MNREEIRDKIEQAKELVGGEPADPFTRIAFEVVFRKLLEATEGAKTTQPTPLAIPKMHITEVLASKNLKSHMDKVEAIAWHFLRQGEDSVTAKDIFDAYARARLQRPKNLTDVVNQSVRRGHLADSAGKKNDRKAWSITPTGERYIGETLLSEAKQ